MISPRAFWCFCFLGCLAPFLLAGCGGKDAPSQPGSKGETGKGAKATAPEENLPELKGEVKLDVAKWDDIENRIAAHKGKIVVVDVWSNYCEPCLKEFPGLVRLQRKFPDEVVCMSVNTNFGGGAEEPTEQNKSEALATLNKHGAKFENFVSSTPDEILIYQLLETSLPSVLVYDRDGTRVKVFNNDKKEYPPEFTYDKDVIPFVKKLVETKPVAATGG